MNLEKAVVTYQDDTNECSKQKLLKKMMNYYYPVVKEYCLGILGKVDEDLIQCGYIGLGKALDRFDRTKGKKFNTLAGIMIRGEMLRYVRDCYHHVREPSHYQEEKKQKHGITKNNFSIVSLEEWQEESERIETVPISVYVQQLTGGDELYKNILNLRVEGLSYREIGEKLKMNMWSVFYILQKMKKTALKKGVFSN